MAASAGASYGIDVADGEHEWNTGGYVKTVVIGGAVGGLTAGAAGWTVMPAGGC